ncbi:nitroreductase family protein [bacterium]|nr:nitroreductase family protein [bacterium]
MSEFKRREFLKSSLLTAGLGAGAVLSCAPSKQEAESDLTIMDAIMKRRSVRHFKPDPVPEADLRMILDAARMAATAGNQQPWKFIVTRDPAVILKLKEACIAASIESMKKRENPSEEKLKENTAKVTEYYDRCFSAPIFVTILTDNKSRWPSYNHWDGPMAAGNLMIAARALGYGTVFYTDSVPDAVTKKVLNIPDQYERVCITPIGIPVEWPETPEKKDLESFIVKESF